MTKTVRNPPSTRSISCRKIPAAARSYRQLHIKPTMYYQSPTLLGGAGGSTASRCITGKGLICLMLQEALASSTQCTEL